MKEKSYKWIIAFVAVVAVCLVGRFVRDNYENTSALADFEPVDVENVDVEELVESADEDREEYIIKVNINTATAEELCTVKGLGASTADKIIAYRNDYGNFKNTSEIMLVKGIGEKTFEKISKYITVEQIGE